MYLFVCGVCVCVRACAHAVCGARLRGKRGYLKSTDSAIGQSRFPNEKLMARLTSFAVDNDVRGMYEIRVYQRADQ